MNCRHCSLPLSLSFVDLGKAPPSNAYLSKEDLGKPEKKYPLRVLVCRKCWLVQTEDFVAVSELFRPDYAYFSSTSKSWLIHAEKYCKHIVSSLRLKTTSFVVEVACNDGYLLKNFVSLGIPCLGIEPTASTAKAAEKLGVRVVKKFFTEQLAKSVVADKGKADLIIGNNVYAHVPDINDFTRALQTLLKPNGVVTLEFPHLLKLIKQNQFDTIYHEHFSYLSLHAVKRIFESAGLRIYQANKLSTHGGSLRVYGCLKKSKRLTKRSVYQTLREERTGGLLKEMTYKRFQHQIDKTKKELLKYLRNCKKKGLLVAAYGAAAKGNTLLNYAGVRKSLIKFVCDAAPQKQGKYMPGSHIPILSPEVLLSTTPKYVVILPYNIAHEIISDLRFKYIKKETKVIVCIPKITKL